MNSYEASSLLLVFFLSARRPPALTGGFYFSPFVERREDKAGGDNSVACLW